MIVTFFFFNDTATTEIYTLSLHDALPIFDPAGIDVVVNTHLHADHCGGNRLFAGRPVYVQRRELDDARSQDGYTIREWVDRKSTRLNSSHANISYAVFCLKKKNQ